MIMPITLERSLDMLERYNTAFWPLHLVAYVLGLVAAVLALRRPGYSGRPILGILSLLWLWVGVVFNGVYFVRLFAPAIAFAVLFVLQAILLAVAAVSSKGVSVRAWAGTHGAIGGLFVLYAMVGYPAIEYLLGRGYPRLLPFGLAPCLLTVFTLGLLLWSDRRLPWYVPGHSGALLAERGHTGLPGHRGGHRTGAGRPHHDGPDALWRPGARWRPRTADPAEAGSTRGFGVGRECDGAHCTPGHERVGPGT